MIGLDLALGGSRLCGSCACLCVGVCVSVFTFWALGRVAVGVCCGC